jgi:hypothetical protein
MGVAIVVIVAVIAAIVVILVGAMTSPGKPTGTPWTGPDSGSM